MLKAEITGPKSVKIIEVPIPVAKENWAVVKINSAHMCTEYKAYESGEYQPPLGHEAAGEVVEIAQPGRVKVGDRVIVMPQFPCGTCSLCIRGEYIHCQKCIDIKEFTGSTHGTDTYAQFILKPDWLLPQIPEAMSYDHAGMLCCGLGPTFGAMERMGTSAFDTVLITGMGPVGLGGIINAKYYGARVVVTVRNPYRAELAKKLGADLILDQDDKSILTRIMDFTDGIGVDQAIECAGSETAQMFCIEATRRNGGVAFVGESGELTLRVSDNLIRNGLTLYGIWHYNLNGIPKLLKIAKSMQSSLDILITHQFSLEDIKSAWELQITRQCGKVVIHP